MWKIYSILTVTGDVGSPIDPVTASWDIELNKIESLSVTVKKKDFLRREKRWWHPWSAGLLLTFTDTWGREEPWIAGPIYDYGNESVDELQLQCAGIRKVLEHRTIWQNLSYKNMTYGDIAWSLIKHALDRPGGSLPIEHGISTEDGRYERTYEHWNLANNGIDKRLTELSEVINGPDMMFRPVWANDEHTKIKWVFTHGTSLSPLIPQLRVPDFDTTAARTEVLNPSITTSGAGLRHRVWCTGAGEGEGTAFDFAQDLKGVEQWQPFLEDVISDADQSEKTKLKAKADGALRTASAMVDQLSFKFDGYSKKNPVGSFHVGDRASVTLKGWHSIPDGTREMTILKMSGGLSHEVSIDFQEDSW